MYENCTIVTTNLEIAHLYPDPGSEFDLSFFENIREVYGYVLVANNHVSRIPLTSLRVIRGLVQFNPQSNGVGFSLYVAENYRQRDGVEMGLQVLELPSLRGGRLLTLHYITLEAIKSGLIKGNFKDHYGEAVKRQCLDTIAETSESSLSACCEFKVACTHI